MGRILGLDLGDVRIGVAVSDATRIIASPFTTINVKTQNVISELKKIVLDYEIKKIVYGLPISLDNTKKRQAEKVRIFIKNLQKSFLEIEFIPFDERYTTTIAQNALLYAKNKKTKEHKDKIDKVAAAVLLQGYLDFLKINM